MVVESKNRKIEKFFIPYQTSTYGENAVYNFVNIRIKRAGGSNYGGIYDLWSLDFARDKFMTCDLRLTIWRQSLSFSTGHLTVMRKQESILIEATDSASSEEWQIH